MQDDRSAIVNTINLYAVAVDARRYDLFEHVFTDDIRCDFGGGAAFTDRQTLTSVFEQIHAIFDATQHITSGHVVSISGDRASCLSYVDGRFRRKLTDGVGLFSSTGWYDDMLTRTPLGWRIQNRVSRMVTYSGDVRVMQAMPGVDTDYQLVALYAEAAEGRLNFLRDEEALVSTSRSGA